MIRMTSACPIGIQRDHGIAIKLHAFEQDATETLPLLERANEEGYKAASSDIFQIVALPASQVHPRRDGEAHNQVAAEN